MSRPAVSGPAQANHPGSQRPGPDRPTSNRSAPSVAKPQGPESPGPTDVLWSGHHRLAHRLAVAAIIGVAVATVFELAMHVVPGGRRLDPLDATISAYALEPGGWLFSAGVIILAVASLLLAAALLLARLLHWRGGWAIWYALWCIGLVCLTAITKTTIGPNDSVQSRIHWSFTLLAFVSLPLSLLLMVRDIRRRLVDEQTSQPRPLPRPLRAARVLMWIAVGWFVLLAGQSALSVLDQQDLFPWVGVLERGVALTEMAAVVCLGWWVIHEAAAIRDGRGDPLLPGHLPPAEQATVRVEGLNGR